MLLANVFASDAQRKKKHDFQSKLRMCCKIVRRPWRSRWMFCAAGFADIKDTCVCVCVCGGSAKWDSAYNILKNSISHQAK